ncbi:homocysteine S-methyltransferase [Paraphoma chrysanthemicola]|uniref:Homocysteine S-methyltransferase n=1 Tax=Paraphoma chrysanthemicola TaxID=798071 RepID=A0A8K0W4K5_9PLEO|nr:homocysteine S-methyltransferase [Paraphoma chrysanthemicola]
MSPPNPISTHLTTHPTTPLILDGALATYLETLGADISSALWSASILLDQPSLIHRTHLDYFRSGANIAITASYQASIPGLVKHLGLSEVDAKAVVHKSVELARQAREDFVRERDSSGDESVRGELFVAGSVGPYGAFLADGSEYRGDYDISRSDMKDFHRGRIEALVAAGVDVLACETLPAKSEIEALIELLRDEFPGTEAWFTFTLRDGKMIADGTGLDEIAALFDNVPQVIGLGVNCVPDDLALEAIRNLKKVTEKALVVYPNSGEQWNAKAREWEGRKTEGSNLALKTVEWWEAGAVMIGGCCRTTPEDIGTMAQALKVRE